MKFRYTCEQKHTLEREAAAEDSVAICRVCGDLAFRDPDQVRLLEAVTR